MSTHSTSDTPREQVVKPVAFISYAREDRDLVLSLARELERRDVSVTGDWQIPATVPYMDAVHSLIQTANTFVFVVSQNSIDSSACHEELDYAFGLNKRLAPVVIQTVDDESIHPALRSIQFVFILRPDEVVPGADSLLRGIEIDLGWERKHNRLLARAMDWDFKERNNSLTLRKADLQEAELWLAQAGADQNKKPRPTDLQVDYINASRSDEKKRQRIAFGAVSFGLAVAIVLGFIALVKRAEAIDRQKEAEQQRQIAQEKTTIAESQTTIANSQTRIAEQEKIIADAQKRIAEERTKIADEQRKIAEAQTRVASQQRANAVRAADEAKRRLISLYEEQGRQASLNRDAQASVMYLSQAHKERQSFGKLGDSPALRFLLGWDSWRFAGQIASLGHHNRIFSAEFSRDGKRLLTASDDTSAKLWDTTSGNLLLTVGGYELSLKSAFLSPDSTRILAAGTRYEPADGENYGDYFLEADLFDAVKGGWIEHYRIAKEPSPDRLPDFKPIFSSDNKTFQMDAADDRDQPATKLFDVATGQDITPNNYKPMSTPRAKPDPVASPCGLPPAEILDIKDSLSLFIRKAADQPVEIWETKTCKQIRRLDGHNGDAFIARFSPDGNTVVTVGEDDRAIIWNWREIKSPAVASLQNAGSGSQFCSDGQNMAVFSQEGKVSALNIATNRLIELGKLQPLLGGRDPVSADGNRALIEGEGGTDLWDVPNHRIIKHLVVRKGRHEAEAWGFSPNGKYLVTFRANEPDVIETSHIYVWDAVTGNRLTSLEAAGDQFDSIAVSWDGAHVFASVHGRTRGMWVSGSGGYNPDWFDGKKMHAGNVTYATFSRDGNRVVTAGDDRTVKIWNKNGELIRNLNGHKSKVESALFSPDDSRIITMSEDGTIMLWDPSDGNRLFSTKGHAANDVIAFSSDSSLLITIGVDNQAKIWDTKTGQLLTSISVPNAKVTSAVFSENNRRFSTTSSDGVIRIWDAQDETRSASQIAEWVKRVIPLKLEDGRLLRAN